MRLGILSDIHDNVWKLAAALDALHDADSLICCGDLCSPFIIHQMGAAFSKPIHIVFGNNDADLFRITANARKYAQIRIHAELFRADLAGKRVAANHYDAIAQELARSGSFDVVCYGHNHLYDVRRCGPALAINPGAIMGAKFGPEGQRTDVASTFVLYDTESDTASGFQIGPGDGVAPL